MKSVQRGEAGAETSSDAERGTTFAAQRDEKDDEKEVYPQGNAEGQDAANNLSADDHSSRTAVPPPDAQPASGASAPEASKDPEAKRTTLETFVIMLCLCASVFLAALDTTIITTALPTISEYFQSSAGYTWIGSAYLLANAASTPIWGKLSDIWGRKPILLCAAGVFLLGSGLAGGSSSIAMLIAARAIQGVGGGGLIILSNICISDLFSMRSRGKYFGVCGPSFYSEHPREPNMLFLQMIGGVWAFAGGVGPILGGVFTQKVSWRWCFYVNLPITGSAIIGIFFFLHLDNPRTPVWAGLKAVDIIGSLTIICGTLMLLLGLEFGGVTYPWNSATVICLIVFGIFTGFLFVLNEWKLAKYPVMPLRLFKNRSNIACLGVCFCHGFVFIAGSYYLPLYYQAVLGATPLLSGVYLLPFALTLAFVSAGTGIFIKKTGKYLPPIWFGLVFMTIGFGLFIDLGINANWAKIIIFQIVAGIGVGPNFQSPLIALQSTVHPRDIATATATFGFTRNLSTAISVVIGGVVFQNQMVKKTAQLVAGLGPQLANDLSGGSAGANVGLVQSLPPVEQAIAKEAFYESLRTMWIMVCPIFMLHYLIKARFLLTLVLVRRIRRPWRFYQSLHWLAQAEQGAPSHQDWTSGGGGQEN